MTKKIFAIHGAFSSPKMFNYLVHKLGKEYTWTFLDYHDKTDGLDSLIDSVTPMTEPYHIVGHSMGGLIALCLINQPWVASVTTISTPLGGININIMQSYLSRSAFMQDISSHGNFINKINNISTKTPVQHLVSTTGFNPWLYEPNDGVITIKSQRAMKLGKVYDIDSNHIEILLNDTTVEILKSFWK